VFDAFMELLLKYDEAVLSSFQAVDFSYLAMALDHYADIFVDLDEKKPRAAGDYPIGPEGSLGDRLEQLAAKKKDYKLAPLFLDGVESKAKFSWSLVHHAACLVLILIKVRKLLDDVIEFKCKIFFLRGS
jgi:hypothetical protein